jgi:adenosylcobyric acid synthase
MTALALMLQGTGSDVGKSTLVAGLCRVAARRGIKVAPFKAQNMSNNAAACPAGGEIGRAQALQARAAGLAPHSDMNPVLLKPQSDRRAQVVVQGKAMGALEAADYPKRRLLLMDAVRDSFQRLANQYDLVLVEGAGSPAEINLRAGDIANMGFACDLGVPVVLIGDIDRGGVIASLVGTKAVLTPEDAAMITGFIVNRFRGDPALFDDGRREIIARTGWADHGLMLWQNACAKLPAEDAVILERGQTEAKACVVVAVPMLSRISNFDDLDPLKLEPNVEVIFVPPGQILPRHADVIIIPGTKSTRADLDFLRAQGWDVDIGAHVRGGGNVLGLCGGYQMLGRLIHDPDGYDGVAGTSEGLGLLDIETVMSADKTVRPASGTAIHPSAPVHGYEIHTGQTSGPATSRPFAKLTTGNDGAISADGRIAGTYLHGVFGSDAFRCAWLNALCSGAASDLGYELAVEAALDELADACEAQLDIDTLFASARPLGWTPKDR